MAPLPVNQRDYEPLVLGPLLDRGSQLQPDNLIITKTKLGYQTQTYLEHQRRCKRLASALQQRGIQLEDRVGTLLWNTAWHMECYHAIPCMGAVLHTLNLRLGPADLGYIIQHANDRMIICDFDLLKLLAQVEPSMLQGVELLICVGEDGVANEWELPTGLDSSKTIDYEEFLNSGDPEFEWPKFPETTTMGLCYTSGTTGKPKGAAYSHRSTYLHTLVLAQGDQLCLRGYEVVLPFVPMFHVLSWCLPFAMMMGGVRSVLTSRFMDPATMVQMIIDWKVALSTGVPTVWRGVRNYIEQQGLETMRPRLASFNRLICAGSAPPMELMRWFFQELGVECIQGWGMTETNPVGSIAQRVCKYSDLSKTEEETLKNVTKQGLPCPGVQVRIADMDDFSREAPRGEAGELMVRGPFVIQEYFQTEAPNKFHEGWLATGDVAKIDHEGAIVITDRSKDVVKSGGEWISSIDMENQISAMAEIESAAVVAAFHPKWDERPIAVVTLAKEEPGHLLSKVRQHLSMAFAKFQLPDDVLVWNALPLTGTGKIDKKAIRAQLKAQNYQLPELITSPRKGGS
ncbi:unnamed protein product [Durusdinium trenchii]